MSVFARETPAGTRTKMPVRVRTLLVAGEITGAVELTEAIGNSMSMGTSRNHAIGLMMLGAGILVSEAVRNGMHAVRDSWIEEGNQLSKRTYHASNSQPASSLDNRGNL